MRSSGFDEATQKKLTSFEPNTLTTAISRETVDPSLAWHQDPVTKTRSQLRAERRVDNVRTLDAATEKNARDGVLGAEARVQRRIDQNIVFLQAAPLGESREALMQRRRDERASAALAAYNAYQPPQPPTFAGQDVPFWKLQRELGDGRQPREYHTTTEAETRKTLSTAMEHAANDAARVTATLPADSPAVAHASAVLAVREAAAHNTPSSASAPELLPNGSQSYEMLKARQRFWAKPDNIAAVCPELPRADDPFKLGTGETTFLNKKLTSGPKKSQRGYPPETRQVAEKVTMLPPPPAVNVMADDPRLVPFRQYSGAKYKFLPSEPREMIPGQDQTSFDGYEFTQPLYSSFTNDKTFQPPRLPPRPQPRSRANAGPALRERARPSTTTGSRFEGRTGQHPSSAPNGPGNGGLGPMTPAMRPGTAAMGALRG